jgi:hypothetical protein
MAQRTASTMLDFPHPFGPTMAVIGSGKVNVVRSTNDLNPWMSRRLIFIGAARARAMMTMVSGSSGE